MEGLELSCFQIISSAGSAKSNYIEAIQYAKEKKFEQAEKLIEEGMQVYNEGHSAHAQLIQDEASGNETNPTLLLIHAEDQLMNAESFRIVAQEFINVYKVMK
ncbi:PTS lactose/cellobiose transporter subunit IIA [Amphibacillus sp. Q70]|uniref:PTS lactose/cellobiose transporter subunit IIA n=1 Tax=Amphibacillus sp. Q70 TaxID=3453416 RepID=UPI003F8795E0